jgi:hypothetical protein
MANPAECGIQVFCRVRPLNEIERKNGSTFMPKFNGNDGIVVGVSFCFPFVFLKFNF